MRPRIRILSLKAYTSTYVYVDGIILKWCKARSLPEALGDPKESYSTS